MWLLAIFSAVHIQRMDFTTEPLPASAYLLFSTLV